MKRFPSSILLLLFCLGSGSVTFGQEHREITKTLPLNKQGIVIVDTYKGSIDVTTWEKSEIEIVARIEVDESFFDDGEQDVRDTEIRINGSADEVRIKSDYDKLRHHHNGFWGLFGDNNLSLPSVHYKIKMPKTASLTIKDYKSDSHIAGLHSSVEINTYKGDVEISDLVGSLDLETYKGNARIGFSELSRNSRVETYKGEISISLPKKTGFVLESDFGRRTSFESDFDVESHSHGKRRSKEVDYYGTINGGGPSLRLKSEKGNFTLRQSS